MPFPPESISEAYATIDAEIRGGDFARARRRLRRSAEEIEVTRPSAPWIAELYRRVGQPDLGARLLFRYVHPSESEAVRIRATTHELAEYGGCLIRLYAVREAERVLARLPDSDSRKHYFLAFARIHEWNYASALELLRRYERLPPDSPYVALVARVNLADCLVETGQFAAAETALTHCLHEVRTAGARLLEANTLELIAKNRTYARDAQGAARAIAEARVFLGPAAQGTADAFFLERLERISALRLGTRTARRALFDFQKRARSAGQFEIARDTELHLAEFTRDETLYRSLYFGTPFPAYRRKIESSAQNLGFEIPDHHVRTLAGEKKNTSRFTPRHPLNPSAVFKPGSLLERLFLALSADFYRPRRLLEIYEATYPGQTFNPISSRNQIHQGMKRLRREFARRKLPLRIEEDHETYTLHSLADVSILFAKTADPEERYREKLLGRVENRFSSREAATIWDVSKNSAIAILNRLVARGTIERSGAGPGMRYLLASPK